MKKKILSLILIFCLIVPCSIMFTACGKDKDNTPTQPPAPTQPTYAEFQELENGKTLNVGYGEKFINSTDSKTVEYYMEYIKNTRVKLRRSAYQVSNSFEYEGFYYYWSYEHDYENELLGNVTSTTKVTYKYLPYSNNTCINVKTIIEQTTSYDFEIGLIERENNITFELYNYFTSMSEIVSKCPELAKAIEVEQSTKHFISTPTKQLLFKSYA